MDDLKAFQLTRDIPALYPHNHASNLHVLANGDILCVWFSGSREGKPDISIMCSRLKKDEKEWSQPIVLSDDTERSEQNPVLFENTNGELWLIYTAQNAVHQESSVVRYRISTDNGYTWSEIRTLFDKPGIFVRNKPIKLETGELVLPAYYSLKSRTGFLGNDFSVVKISNDHGKTWTEHVVKDSKGLVHMSIVSDKQDNLLGFFRSRKADYIYISKSNDHGRTWTTPKQTELMNNNASIQVIRLKNDELAIIFNDVNAELAPPNENRPPWFDKSDMDKVGVDKNIKEQESIWGVIRAPLTIALSDDDGETWNYKKNIITKEDVFAEHPEFSYPSIKQTDDGKIHITFTYLRHFIKHVVVTEEWIKS
ncbi:sialidase family protein [Gracilibacillus sp. S3-1-1]|uniref:Sialidase family protein n=1 Tax=Gracilibacillus pellucidus TaxID=3095368 RepID=A0ACC6M3K4_9BACI|nr:sialidase family protein [Gracilibacillus sp. S3-1-1]MDX8045514.1 sialidase family protein [Gracilibacillus sp. S3-1-1]